MNHFTLPSAQAPDTAIFQRRESGVRTYSRAFPRQFGRAENVWLHDANGGRYLDFLSGCSTLNYGHNHPSSNAHFSTISRQTASRTGRSAFEPRFWRPSRHCAGELLRGEMPPPGLSNASARDPNGLRGSSHRSVLTARPFFTTCGIPLVKMDPPVIAGAHRAVMVGSALKGVVAATALNGPAATDPHIAKDRDRYRECHQIAEHGISLIVGYGLPACRQSVSVQNASVPPNAAARLTNIVTRYKYSRTKTMRGVTSRRAGEVATCSCSRRSVRSC